MAKQAPQTEVTWAQVWQLPVLLLGLGLLALGVYMAVDRPAGPDFPGSLDSAAQYLAANNLDRAKQTLGEMDPQIFDHPAATRRDKARFHAYRADLNYLQQAQQHLVAVDTPAARAVSKRVVDDYRQAEDLGFKLDAKSLGRLARSLVDLGEEDKALAVVDRLKDQPAAARYRIIKSLIQRRHDAGADAASLSPLVQRFREEIQHEPDTDQRLAQRIWVSRLQGQMLLDAGDPAQAIDFLVRRMLRLQQDGARQNLAPLQLLLAQAYQRTAELDKAQRYYQLAQQGLIQSDPLNAEVLVGQGQVALSMGPDHLDEAGELFATAVRDYPNSPAYIDALIGKGHVQARQQRYADAHDTFKKAVDRLMDQAPANDPRRRELTDTVRSHVDFALDRKDYDIALNFLQLITPLHRGEKMPSGLVLDLARVHEKIAERESAYAALPGQGMEDPEQDAVPGPEDMTPAQAVGEREDQRRAPSREARRLANQKAAMHFDKAGDGYRRYARDVSITDNQAHGDALWSAAICYDRAQQWDKAIEVYSDFVKTRGEDFRQFQARHHLGRALLARGDFQAALDQFKSLQDDEPNSPWTFASMVPMAKCYQALGKPGAAERALLQVVTDHPAIRPESEEYRQALVALGKLYYRLGEKDPAMYVKAIQRLTEAVQRYHQSWQGPELRFLLADALRCSVDTLDKQLDQDHAQRQRLALVSERNRRLAQAQKLYNQVVTELEDRSEAQLDPLDKLYRRNSYFYQADCAFARQRYEQAIDLYTLAAKRWENQPASLVALVQIVNAYCEMDQWQEAEVANRQALRQLDRMPDSAFENNNLPMSRENWEDWLRWTSELNVFGQGKGRGQTQTASTSG